MSSDRNHSYERVLATAQKINEYNIDAGNGELIIPHYNWNEIDFTNIETCIIGGNVKSGKTKIMTAFVTHLVSMPSREYGAVYLCSPTYSSQKDLRSFIPASLVINPKTQDIYKFIMNLMESQKQIKEADERNGTNNIKHVIFIMDDVLGLVNKSNALCEIFASGRHYNITTFLLLQHLKTGLSNPLIRGNATFIMVTKFTYSSKELIVDDVKNIIGDNKLALQFVNNVFKVPYLFIGMTNLLDQPDLFTISIDDIKEFRPVKIEWDEEDDDEQTTSVKNIIV